MTREEMLTKIIQNKGFENNLTIYFAELVENKNIADSALEKVMITILNTEEEAEE